MDGSWMRNGNETCPCCLVSEPLLSSDHLAVDIKTFAIAEKNNTYPHTYTHYIHTHTHTHWERGRKGGGERGRDR